MQQEMPPPTQEPIHIILPPAKPSQTNKVKVTIRFFRRYVPVSVASAVLSALITCQTQWGAVDLQKQQLQADRAKLDVERDRLNEDKRQFDAKQNVATVSAQTRREEKEMERLEKSVKENRKLADDLAGKYYAVFFENKCDVDISVVVAYQSLDDNPYVSGWFNFVPGERGRVMETQHQDIYYFAQDTKGRIWEGDFTRTVSDSSFDYIEDAHFQKGWFSLPGTVSEKKFRKVRIDTEPYQPFTLQLTCK